MAVLLLQGPLGPFFQHFAARLVQAGETVHKVNFNGGDGFYSGSSPTMQHNFTGQLSEWSAYLARLIQEQSIQSVFVYGDCRDYHHKAKQVCAELGIRYFAFEEGYLRPNYITVEEGGVNGHSPITHGGVAAYEPVHKNPGEIAIGGNFRNRIWFASAYYNVSAFKRWTYRHYQHHRSFSPVYEAYCWLRSGFRKIQYKWTERRALDPVLDQPFFLVPLQVHNDAQIIHHSPYECMEEFIEQIMASFSDSGSQAKLVIKHHPMDRGHTHYGKVIARLAKRFGIQKQVVYLHDHHMPTLLKHCRGVITINSTTALQAFYHGAPVKVMGEAFFDMPGLTDQKGLDEFWFAPEFINMDFADRFRAYLEDHGQINGSFYCQWDLTLDNLLAYLQKLDAISSTLPEMAHQAA